MLNLFSRKNKQNIINLICAESTRVVLKKNKKKTKSHLSIWRAGQSVFSIVGYCIYTVQTPHLLNFEQVLLINPCPSE